MQDRLVIPAASGVACGWTGRDHTGTRLTCQGGKNAVHVLTATLPVGEKGTALCGFHSPYDVTDADRAETAGSSCIDTLRELLTLEPVKAPKEPTFTMHYVENADVRAACGLDPKVSSDNPNRTTCNKCKTTRRYLDALYRIQVATCRAAFGELGLRAGMMVRHRTTGVLGVILTIDTTASLGYWGVWRETVARGEYVFTTPSDLLAAVEIITVDDLVTEGSVVKYAGKIYQVTKVSMADGVTLRDVGVGREVFRMIAVDFAADLSRGMIAIVSLAPSDAQGHVPLPTVEVMPQESIAVAAVLTEKDQIKAFAARMILRAYRTRAKTGMNLTRNFTPTIRGFNTEYGRACRSWADVLTEADAIAREWDKAEGR